MHLRLADRPIAPRAAEALLAHGWLATCTPAFRDWAADTLVWRPVARGDTLTHAGDEQGGFFCLAEGQITFHSSLGGALVTSYFGFPGSWWGQAPMLGVARVGTTTVRTDGLVGVLPAAQLRARLSAHPAEWEQVARGLSDLFVMAAGAHSDMLIEHSANRLAACLLRLGGNRHRVFPVMTPRAFACTQDELARAAGLSRNTAGIHLRSFERAGLIRSGYGEIAILDPQRLTAFANADG